MDGAGTVAVITIDGPASVGKSTVAVLLAKRLGYHLLISGLLYRALALQVIEQCLDGKNLEALLGLAEAMQLEFLLNGDLPEVRLAGKDVTRFLGREDCAALASRIAEVPELRDKLLERQRGFKRLPGLVAEGRDMGTVVFPEAETKVFLSADLEERARRRFGQLKDLGLNVSLARLRRQLSVRDERDKSRQIAPLMPAEGALTIDTTKKSVGMIVKEIKTLAGY